MSINICPMVALAAELTNVPLWLCIPFACLLLCIAIIPLVKGEWWEKYRPFAVIFWSLLFIIPFAVKYGAGTAAETVLECLVNDYLTFIVLLFGLFCVAGNITCWRKSCWFTKSKCYSSWNRNPSFKLDWNDRCVNASCKTCY